MTEEDEGAWAQEFIGKFGQRGNVQKRLHAERRAGETRKKRERRGPVKKQVNFRATAETVAQIELLAKHFQISATDAIAKAIADLASSAAGRKQ